MGRKSNAEKAANEAAEMQPEASNEANQDMDVSEVEQVAEVEEEQIVEQVKEEKVKTVRMVRHADYDGDGAMTADVHPLEVENYKAGGWLVED